MADDDTREWTAEEMAELLDELDDEDARLLAQWRAGPDPRPPWWLGHHRWLQATRHD